MRADRGYRKASLPENAKRVFEGKIFDIYQWEQKLYDGSTAIFEKAVRPDTVAVIPLLPGNQVLLIEDSQPHREAVLTVPTGRIEEGENPEEAARRELLEETGYAVDSLELLQEEHPTQKLDWVVYWYIGRGARQAQDAKPDPGEKISLRITPLEKFIAYAGAMEETEDRLRLMPPAYLGNPDALKRKLEP
jgi:ADP-ribose pyrophosphatase YjhB (NUDIX family)